ncbi:phage holin family protein [Gordonia sp. HY002]|uniref:phage holin family protein n=1 Tax=Gordonia zhenghanii TaxID=2911516 RepID=UPI001EF09774|nr:phage holin family protein [Gordonia zhenghanii]MCF8568696.1 phage holin family protein [Gordonia zhenghanii]MCF8607491.1 phage holin family protein [Gordonia zhenghanii]
MRAFLVRSALTGVALWIATLIVPGVEFDFGDLTSWWTKLGVVLLVAAVFGLVNGFIKPIVQILSIPLYILTLGLIHVIINALMLRLTAWLTDNVFHVGLEVDDIFWSGIFGAIVISIVGWLTALVMRDRLENL